MLALLALLCGASAFVYKPTFHYTRLPTIFRKSEEICKICYGEFDCFTMDKARCEYNAEIDAVFGQTDEDTENEFKNDGMKTKVDSMMYDLMLNDTLMAKYQDCIPLISSYTTCNRDNICTGCQACDCTIEGKWNCSVVQKCKHDSLNIDHRVLVVVMEKLRPDSNSIRSKRSIDTAQDKTRPHKVTYEELSEWMYGSKPMINSVLNKTNVSNERVVDATNGSNKNKSKPLVTKDVSKYKDSTENTTDIGDINILNDSKETRSKLENGYNILDVRKADADDITDKFWQMLAIEEGKDIEDPTPEGSNKVINDVVNENSSGVRNTRNSRKNDTKAQSNTELLMNADADFKEDMNGITFSNMINVFKRDLSHVNKSTTLNNPNNIKNETMNTTEPDKILQSHILEPITRMIQDKNKEIKQLNDIRENLLKFITMYKLNSSLLCNSVDTDIAFPMSKLHEDIHLNDALRRNYMTSDTVILNKYIKKLKLDINEVLKDIFGIRKYQKSVDLSHDFKILLKAIMNFKKNNLKDSKEHVNSKWRASNLRRQLSPNKTKYDVDNIRGSIVKMLEHLDKDMPTCYATSSLSSGSKKLFNRIVNTNYVDDFAIAGLKVNEPYYNLTNDLLSVGLKWRDLVTNIVNSPPADRLFTMKSLYMVLNQDMTKISNALALMKFTISRRMTPEIDENVGNDIVKRINTDLNTADNAMRHYIQHEEVSKKKYMKKPNKKSLLKTIKNLLINSKKNLMKHFRKKQAKSNMLKELERKRIDENKQNFLKVMEKWQNNLDVVSTRTKRYIRGFTKEKNRMKGIIPKYLRGKVNPALGAKSRRKWKNSNNSMKAAKKGLNKTGTKVPSKKKLIIPVIITKDEKVKKKQ